MSANILYILGHKEPPPSRNTENNPSLEEEPRTSFRFRLLAAPPSFFDLPPAFVLIVKQQKLEFMGSELR